MSIDFNPAPGTADRLAPGLVRILANNPSPMTFRGTNTYVLGDTHLAVIDPGPVDPAHLAALMEVIDGRPVSHIIVTHSHLDHSPLATPLAEQTGAPVLAFGASDTGRSAVMTDLAQAGLAGGGEGIDPDFAPDVIVADGDKIAGGGWDLTVLHTPGHMGNHICLRWGKALFCGDLVMGWASSLVSPPDGDLTDFMSSIARLRALPFTVFYPGHGAPITDPMARLDWLRDHRISREKEVCAALGADAQTVAELTRVIYADIAPNMWPVAARNVFAHLVDLQMRGLVAASPGLSQSAHFQLT